MRYWSCFWSDTRRRGEELNPAPQRAGFFHSAEKHHFRYWAGSCPVHAQNVEDEGKADDVACFQSLLESIFQVVGRRDHEGSIATEAGGAYYPDPDEDARGNAREGTDGGCQDEVLLRTCNLTTEMRPLHHLPCVTAGGFYGP